MQDLLYTAGAITAVLGAVTALWRWVIRPIASLVRAVQLFLADWNGEPPRPGFKGRKSVPERLERIEWHVGNGNPVPLRRLVEDNRKDIDQIKKNTNKG